MSPLAAPPAEPEGFPSRWLRPNRRLYRIHRRDWGPWWFSQDRSGRFDLVPPAGTCYLAEAPIGAFVEVFREIAHLSQATVDRPALSVLRVPRAVRLADCTAARARAFGVTAAIHASPNCELTQAWAEALARAGFGGVRYLVSHDPPNATSASHSSGRRGMPPGPSRPPSASALSWSRPPTPSSASVSSPPRRRRR